MRVGDVRVAFVLMEGIESVECTVVSGAFKKHLDNVLRYVVWLLRCWMLGQELDSVILMGPFNSVYSMILSTFPYTVHGTAVADISPPQLLSDWERVGVKVI